MNNSPKKLILIFVLQDTCSSGRLIIEYELLKPINLSNSALTGIILCASCFLILILSLKYLEAYSDLLPSGAPWNIYYYCF